MRYYAQGGYGAPASAAEESGTYRGGDYQLWVQDVQLGTVEAVPGLVDLFVRMDYAEQVRQFHYRVSLLSPSVRTDQRVEVVYFGRFHQRPELQEARAEVAAGATEELLERERNRASTEAVMQVLPTWMRAELEPTLVAAIYIEMARVAVAGSWPERESEAMTQMAAASLEGRVFGGMDDAFWEDIWEDRMDREGEGEGGSGEPDPNIDRTGDGIEDEDQLVEETDDDGGPAGTSATLAAGQAVEAQALACSTVDASTGAVEACLQGVLGDFVAAGGQEAHVHKQQGPGGHEIHAKVKRGRVTKADAK